MKPRFLRHDQRPLLGLALWVAIITFAFSPWLLIAVRFP